MGVKMGPRYKGQFVSNKTVRRYENLKNTGLNNEKKAAICEEAVAENTEEDEGKRDEIGGWTEGRRVVELQILAEGLKECRWCKSQLHLINCVNETLYGLGSILYIECQECKNLNSVPTGKRHSASLDGDGPRKCFDVNSKLAAGILFLLSHCKIITNFTYRACVKADRAHLKW